MRRRRPKPWRWIFFHFSHLSIRKMFWVRILAFANVCMYVTCIGFYIFVIEHVIYTLKWLLICMYVYACMGVCVSVRYMDLWGIHRIDNILYYKIKWCSSCALQPFTYCLLCMYYCTTALVSKAKKKSSKETIGVADDPISAACKLGRWLVASSTDQTAASHHTKTSTSSIPWYYEI